MGALFFMSVQCCIVHHIINLRKTMIKTEITANNCFVTTFTTNNYCFVIISDGEKVISATRWNRTGKPGIVKTTPAIVDYIKKKSKAEFYASSANL